MKVKIDNYSFDKTAKTVAFADYTAINLDAVLLIVNVTDGIIIYNFADPTKGGTVLTNVLTLDYDTSAMDNSDKLLVYYDDSTTNPSTSENQAALKGLIETLQELCQRLAPLGGAMSSGAVGLRVVGVSMPSTVVTGPQTSAQFIAAFLTSKIALENMAAQANINNAVGA